MEIKTPLKILKSIVEDTESGKSYLPPLAFNALLIAVGALEKQVSLFVPHNEFVDAICPNCSVEIYSQFIGYASYCIDCGQGIKWEE